MQICRLKINNFRNYETATVDFGPGLNIIAGDNAQGKTNLVEALVLCSIGRSPRTPRDKELIKNGCPRAEAETECRRRSGSDKVRVILNAGEKKCVTLNGMPLTRLGELMGHIGTVFFSPDELKIVKSSPSERRRFMDIALCQLSRAYFYLVNRYNKILNQRNKLLKSRDSSDALEIWDTQLVEIGSRIIKTRRGFAARLSKEAEAAHHYLTDGDETLAVSYDSINGDAIKDIEQNFALGLKRGHEKDTALGFTGTGPQKDDLIIETDGRDVRSFGSQGQQRTAALALKLAEMKILREETGEYPILILDDVLSELDVTRQKKLLGCLSAFQSIITCTHLTDELKDTGEFKYFTVKAGHIKEN